jgi:hypothetical protein
LGFLTGFMEFTTLSDWPGIMECWNNGMMESSLPAGRDGTMEEWNDGTMEEWNDGMLE